MAMLERDHAVTCGKSIAPSRAPKPRARHYRVAGRPLRRLPATTSKRGDVMAGWDIDNGTSVSATDRLWAALIRLGATLLRRKRRGERAD